MYLCDHLLKHLCPLTVINECVCHREMFQRMKRKTCWCSSLVRILANQALALHYVHGQGLERSCICVYGAQRGRRSDVNIGSRAAVCLK